MGFGTKRRVICKQIVDCTGGAEVVGLLDLNAFVVRRGNQPVPFKIGDPTILHQANSAVFMCTVPTPLILELSPWPT